jgi:hypothetical protein
MMVEGTAVDDPAGAPWPSVGACQQPGGVVLNVWDSELWNVADWYRIEVSGGGVNSRSFARHNR